MKNTKKIIKNSANFEFTNQRMSENSGELKTVPGMAPPIKELANRLLQGRAVEKQRIEHWNDVHDPNIIDPVDAMEYSNRIIEDDELRKAEAIREAEAPKAKPPDGV